MALSFRFAIEADIPALLKLRVAVDADQEKRFGKNRWSTRISERSGSGVGRQLMKRAKAAASEWPVDAIRLDAYDGPAGGGPFSKHADSRRWGAQCIEMFRFSISSPSILRESRVDA